MKISHAKQLDLEKRQQRFRQGELRPLPSRIVKLSDGTLIERRPAGTGLFSAPNGHPDDDIDVIGAWKD
jgi:hypothetical protein